MCLTRPARSSSPTTPFSSARVIEATGQHQRRVASRAIAGHLPPRQSLTEFDFSFQPSLSERHIRELATLSFVQTATSVVFLGSPGVGKTHLATAQLSWLMYSQDRLGLDRSMYHL